VFLIFLLTWQVNLQFWHYAAQAFANEAGQAGQERTQLLVLIHQGADPDPELIKLFVGRRFMQF